MTKKISQLPAATSVDTNDEFVINQDGTTKKLTTANEWQFSDVNIDGGNIDGTAIGVSSASSGAFTTLTASDDVNFATNALFVDASAGNVGVGTNTPETFGVNARSFEVDGSGKLYSFISNRTTNVQSVWTINEDTDVATISNTSNHPLVFGTNDTERMRIDSSGNVGIGTTSPSSRLQILANSPTQVPLQSLNTNNNVDTDPTVTQTVARLGRVGKTGVTFSSEVDFGVSRYESVSTNARTQMDIRLSHGATGAPEATVMTLRSNGNVGIGTTSPSEKLEVREGYIATHHDVNTTGAGYPIRFYTNGGSGGAKAVMAEISGIQESSDNGRIIFNTRTSGTNSEKMRIDSSGNVRIGTTVGGTRRLQVNSSSANYTIGVNNSAGVPYGLYVEYSATSPNNTGSSFFVGTDSTTARVELRSNGGIANFSANNVNLSDERVKKDIENLNSQWDCIKKWQLVEFRYKEQTANDPKNYGVIAQQIEKHCPNLVEVFQKASKTKEERIGVKEQQMVWMSIKALQEAMERIEVIESELNQLKGSQ